MRTITATEFKAKCLALLDEVQKTGEPITVSKRGKPVAQVVPHIQYEGKYPQDSLKGTVEVLGDIIEPAIPLEDWNMLRDD
ncbi:MAG: type II toxin-antitoxin system Phd/YefM family antitoxin [Nitrospirae bacterium]|nr:type II toxin-antitoxin system Phd/YefM family antitoxin [Nitrospirota bacterium]